MTKFFTCAAIIIGLCATVTLAIRPRTMKPSTATEVPFAAEGAFRDGLYLGKLAAENGGPPRLAIGRWSTDRDRAMFTAGYRGGYNASLIRVASERCTSCAAESRFPSRPK